MQATPYRAAALLALLLAVSLPGCDGDEPPSKPSCTSCGGKGGSADLGGAGGEAVSSSGTSTHPNGGAGAVGSFAGATGDAGDSPGGRNGATRGGAGGEGGTMESAGEQLELCTRLAHGTQDADTVGSAYVGAVYRDCHVAWLVPRGQALADLVNQIVSFNYNFWGCEKTFPVEAFGLVLGKPGLSQGDVDLLTGHYLTVAQKTLDLSDPERNTMQAALVRLSKLVITDDSLEPSKSSCTVSVGGGGGMGGAGGGGGAGGQP